MATIGTLAVNVVARTGGLVRNLTKGRSLVRSFSIAATAGAAAATAGVAALVRTFDSIAPAIDRAAKTADKLGLTTEALTSLHHAAELSGLSTKTLDMAMQRMTRRVAEAAQGTGEARNALQELDLNAQMLAKLSPDRQLTLIADKMKAVESQADRVRLAFKLFDSEGVNMINMLQNGGAALDAMRADAARLGKTFTRGQAAMVEAANDARTRIGAATDGLKTQLTIALAPAVQVVADRFADWVASFNSGPGAVVKFSESLQGFGDLIAGVADSLHILRIGFLKIQQTLTQTLATLVNPKYFKLLNLASPALGTLIGDPTALHQELQRTANELNANLNSILLKPPPSEKITKFFDAIKEQAEKTAKQAEKAMQSIKPPPFTMPLQLQSFLQKMGIAETPQLPTGVGDFFRGIGQQAGELQNRAFGGVRNAVGAAATALAPEPLVKPRFAPLVTRDSREGAIHAIGTGQDRAGRHPLQRVAKAAETQLKKLDEIRDAITGKNGGGKGGGEMEVKVHSIA